MKRCAERGDACFDRLQCTNCCICLEAAVHPVFLRQTASCYCRDCLAKWLHMGKTRDPATGVNCWDLGTVPENHVRALWKGMCERLQPRVNNGEDTCPTSRMDDCLYQVLLEGATAVPKPEGLERIGGPRARGLRPGINIEIILNRLNGIEQRYSGEPGQDGPDTPNHPNVSRRPIRRGREAPRVSAVSSVRMDPGEERPRQRRRATEPAVPSETLGGGYDCIQQ